MKSYRIDMLIKGLISVFYRLVLSIYALAVLLLNTNYFHWYYYLLIYVIFFICFLLLFQRNSWFSKMRLLNDYVFIVFILYGKELSISNYPFLLIPIFNSPNHSGNRSPFLTYIFTIVSLIILLGNNFRIIYTIPLIFIFFIDLFEQFRSRILRFSNYLYDAIDNFSLQKLHLKKSHLLYKEIIERLNSSKFRFLLSRLYVLSSKGISFLL